MHVHVCVHVYVHVYKRERRKKDGLLCNSFVKKYQILQLVLSVMCVGDQAG